MMWIYFFLVDTQNTIKCKQSRRHTHTQKRNKQTYKTQTHPSNFKTADKEDYIISYKQTNKQTHPSNLKTADKEDYIIFI